MSIFSKVKSWFKKVKAGSVSANKPKVQASMLKVGGAIKGAMGKTGAQPAAVFKARVGEGMTPKQTAKAYQTIRTPKKVEQPSFGVKGQSAIYTTAGLKNLGLTPTSPGVSKPTGTYQGMQMGGVRKGDVLQKEVARMNALAKGGGAIGGTALAFAKGIKPSGTAPKSITTGDAALGTILGTVAGIKPPTGIEGGGATPLAKSYAPSTTSDIISMGTPELGGTQTVLGSTDNAEAINAGLATQNENDIRLGEEFNKGVVANEKEKESIWERMLGEKSQAEVRQDLEAQYGIRAQQSAINSLQEKYNLTEQAMNNQIMATQDKMGSMNFLNLQTDQIKRSAAPELNRLSADINFKSGLLNQDEQLIQQAIGDYNAEKTQRMNMYARFLDDNQDELKNLRQDYKDALDRGWEEAKLDRADGIRESNDKADLIKDAAKYGVDLSGMMSGSFDALQSEYARRMSKVAPSLKEGKGAGDETLDEETINSYVAGLKSGDIQLSNIPDKYRDEVAKKMYGTTGKKYQLKSKISMVRKMQLKNNGIDTAKLSEIESFLNQGYSIDELIEANVNVLTSRQKELLRKIIQEI